MSRLFTNIFIGLIGTVLSFSVMALPSLQLDIIGGSYDTGTESVIAETDAGTLVAYGLTPNGEGDAIDLASAYRISVSLFSVTGVSITSSTTFGSFSFDGTTYSGGDLTFGTPLLEGTDSLQKHGIFPTFYTEVAVDFNDLNTRSGVNTQTTTGSDPLSNTGDDLYYDLFSFNITGLSDDFGLHFDLYEVLSNGEIGDFAPLSHDAQTTVPEPAPLALLGLSLLAVFLNSKRKRA